MVINTKKYYKIPAFLATGLSLLFFTGCGGGGSPLSFNKYPLTEEKEGEDTEWAYVNPSTGKNALEETFETSLKPTPFFNGYATVGERTDDGKEFFFINSSGEEKGDDYMEAGSFNNGLAPVVNEDEPVKYINTSFKTAFKATNSKGKPFLKAKNFHNSLAPVKDLDNKWGFINTSGKVAIEPQYNEVSHFKGGYASVVKKDDDETLRGIINKEGKAVIELTDEYDFLGIPKQGKIRFEEDGDWGFLNLEGKVVIDDDFDQATSFVSGQASVKEDDEWGAINTEGEEVIDIDYDAPVLFFGNYALISDDDEVGVINKEGKEVIDPQYELIVPPVFGEKFLVAEEEELIFVNENNEQVGTEEYKSMSPAFLYMYENLTNPYDYDVAKLPEKTITTQYLDVSKEVSQILGDSAKGGIHGFSAETTAPQISYIKNNTKALFQQERRERKHPDIANDVNKEFQGYLYKLAGDLKYKYERNPYNIIFDEKITFDEKPGEIIDLKGDLIGLSEAELFFTEDILKPNKLVKKLAVEKGYGSVKVYGYMIQGGVKVNKEASLEKITLAFSIKDDNYPDNYVDEIQKGTKEELKNRGFKEAESVYDVEPGTFAVDPGYGGDMEITINFDNNGEKTASR